MLRKTTNRPAVIGKLCKKTGYSGLQSLPEGGYLKIKPDEVGKFVLFCQTCPFLKTILGYDPRNSQVKSDL